MENVAPSSEELCPTAAGVGQPKSIETRPWFAGLQREALFDFCVWHRAERRVRGSKEGCDSRRRCF